MLFEGDYVLKTCTTCGVAKSTTEFNYHRNEKDRLDSRCKPCQRGGSYVTNRLKRIFGPPPRVCECCHQEGTERNPICLDHKHVLDYSNIDITTLFRGWLCSHCNRGLGLIGDDEEAILRMLTYIRMAKKRQLRMRKDVDSPIFSDIKRTSKRSKANGQHRVSE